VEISLNTKTRLRGHGPSWPLSLAFVFAYFHIYWSKSKILLYTCVEEGCSASQAIAHEIVKMKPNYRLEIYSIEGGPKLKTV
jgi:hypothetical protein